MSLDGLQKAARLCCTLGLQQRCGSVFLQLASTSCVLFDTQKSPILERKAVHKTSTSTKLNKPYVICIIFRCSAFISELEHTYFSQGNNQSSLPKLQQEQTAKDVQDQDGCDTELYSVPVTTAVPVAPRINIPNLIKQSSIESGWDRSISGGGVLNSAQASQALCGLSQEVDRLFEDAANKLNLCALLNFLSELSEAGRLQLIKVMKHKEEDDLLGESQQLPSNALHLYRLQEVLMKVVHSDRPYVHLMRCWSVVSSFLVEAAGHHDRNVSRMAVTCVHDFILAMLVDHPELPHFHVNELLCKTFENMLCLELCDGDVQDQIVCSICELVEACTADIRSGWRPLFGALRAVKIEYTTNEEVNEARQRHIAAVLDVFEVYLNTDNILVFANAAVDCILCLLKYVRGPGEFEDLSDDDDDSDTGSDFDVSAPSGENLCVPALGYLRQCSKILQRMWKMPACPVFNGAHRIHTDSDQNFVDTSIPHMDMDDFLKMFNEKSPQDYNKAAGDNVQTEVIAMATKPKSNLAIQRSLDEEDRVYDSGSITSTDSGISSVDKQPNRCQVQSSTVKVKSDTNLETVRQSFRNSSCPKFALYCVNHLLLPMLQNWLRTGAKKHGYWETGATNFKQCCGLCTDLIVDFIEEFSGCKGDIEPMVEMMLKQLLDVLIECISQPVEAISRLGCSCIRHILLSAGGSFTEEMWQIGGIAMQKALDTSTFYIQQLMVLFQINSENFYGDTGQVKVAMRQDSTPMECERLKHLAHQVFLLDSQLSSNEHMSPETEEDKSFVFLLYGQGNENSINPDDIITRIPFRSVVIGLLSNQLLIQTVGSVLLSKDNMTTSDGEQTVDKDGDCPPKMPGMLSFLSTRNVLTFLKCLRSSYKLAGEFDSRPGLKFLIQKVARTAVAVNLYKQAGASMIFYIHTLIQIGASINGMSRKNVRELLKGIHEKDIDIHNVEIDTAKRFDKVFANPETFLHLLTRVCDELCQTYVDILNEDSIVDQMSEQQVFFLIAQPDDISDIVKKKRHSDLSVENESQSIDVIQPGVFLTSEAVSTQEHSLQQDNSDDEDTQDDKKSHISDSDHSSHTMKSKRELREEQESKIYTLATDTLIKSLMTEYKKRKHHHAMPSFVKIGKQKKSAPPSKKTDVDAVIEKQQKSSTMKDSEARKQSWTELLCTILELFKQLPDNKFDSLLPTIFYCVNQLVCHADDRRLKDALGQWLHRVGVMMELSPF
ncbi:hypothetical protein KUTeg_007761 [Tegillarca granosa]|uniref:Brefeldin A-inhibited guanine nucleotide-exchange protein 3 n=1 Tax=Tegillarca granosa TaxID=220873 RepID=A0ABQ9FHG7_TEGGR|nr:hypothetical protein KUTeg_007761 [Tegillarca granosa]